ncbi:MAG: ethanolamine ammonia-lyase reactivating factor EutA [Cyanobacteria bacterium SZAS LIN-3]|nr:ethanolamine ammonia-lyase reactivating factor EutA [Cyanobacteria bacterium SZAS LIN-3]
MKRDDSSILSVGIDIGTTTTHLVVSSLKFDNVARPTQISNVRLTDKEVLFESAIYKTPLTPEGLINAGAVAALIEEAYRQACEKTGLDMKAVDTGAVIITGESARTRNAAEVVSQIAGFAGDFVVESAGPGLESILCARGSGAQLLSKDEGIRVLNVDIGGGTSNFAVIDNGEISDIGVNLVGGKAVVFAQGKILFLSREAQSICREKNLALEAGMSEADNLSKLSLLAAELAAKICGQIASFGSFDQIVLSGGVAALMEKSQDQNPYQDFGVYLALALKQALAAAGLKYGLADNAIRATVLGAGMHTLQLSGSTIDFPRESLPLRNLPLLKIDGRDRDNLSRNVKKALELKEIDWSKAPLTLALSGLRKEDMQYRRLSELARSLAHTFQDLQACEPFVITTQQDVAMALGLLLKRLLPDKRIITVDGICVTDGDYLDIGRPMHSNSLKDQYTAALPVVVKTLVFYKN